MNFAMHETKIHGRIDFPYIVYMGKIPDFLHNYPLHWHDEFEIIYIEDGHGQISVQSNIYDCEKGDLIIIPPEYIHDIKQKGNNSMYYFNILFKFSLLEENENSVCYRKYFLPYTENCSLSSFYIPHGTELNKKIEPHITELIGTRQEKYTTYELMIKSHLYAVLFHTNSLLIPMTLHSRAVSSSITRLKPILKYIHDNYSEDISIQKAAEISNLSESHFMKTFRNLTGMSFINYLNQFRLENAERLLKNTDSSISEICEKCGFHYFSYFIRIFKKKYGCTPTDFRKNGENYLL